MTQTNALNTLQAKLNAGANTDQEPKTLVVEEKFQEYKAARSSMRLITDGGIRITFTNFRLLTQTKEVIEYLDDQLKKGLQGITKGELLTMADVNPMATLRREMEAKVRAEIAEELKQAALGNTKDMGSTEHSAQISPANTKNVAS